MHPVHPHAAGATSVVCVELMNKVKDDVNFIDPI